MTVISISLNEQNIKDLDDVQKDLGFSGRSEAVRTALRMLVAERNERKKMVGNVDGVLIVVTEKGSSDHIDECYHEHQKMIRTHIHNHVGPDRCMNVLIVSGEAGEVNTIIDELERVDGVSYLKFIKS
ncbi:MAG: putative nickel-responsive regulator [Methanomassiliicoccales archaeon PtaU1.Bin124]|nr:MAG: putative nickel-responsive regulator [Methanomassiliicoccales archaeon PtaU1.Bin124]